MEQVIKEQDLQAAKKSRTILCLEQLFDSQWKSFYTFYLELVNQLEDAEYDDKAI